MTDPIRTALEASFDAAIQAYADAPDGWLMSHARLVAHAAGIAAFLRALPYEMTLQHADRPWGFRVPLGTFGVLAAAVERAALLRSTAAPCPDAPALLEGPKLETDPTSRD